MSERRSAIRQSACELLDEYELLMPDSVYWREESYVSSNIQKRVSDIAGETVSSSLSETLSTSVIEPTSIPKKGISGDLHWDGSIEAGTPIQDHVVEKLLYYLSRDFIGYQRIDAVKKDTHIEDISCNGTEIPVFVYHSEYEQLVSNVTHSEAELPSFVRNMAEKTGKAISKREPQVDGTLPDDSRAQLTLGTEVSDRGTNYTIRQSRMFHLRQLILSIGIRSLST
jgi:Type IV secretory pathway, VirB11 components, and related ATPases involved in archaeal flagella biosynthesis